MRRRLLLPILLVSTACEGDALTGRPDAPVPISPIGTVDLTGVTEVELLFTPAERVDFHRVVVGDAVVCDQLQRDRCSVATPLADICAGGTFTWRVEAVRRGASAASADVRVVSPALADPRNVAVVGNDLCDPDGASFDLSWDEPDAGEVEVEVFAGAWFRVPAERTGASVTVPGVAESFRVRAVSGTCSGEWVTLTAPAVGAAGVPQRLAVSAPCGDDAPVDIRWVGGDAPFEVEIDDGTGNPTTHVATDRAFSIGLASGAYAIRVRSTPADCAASDWSESIALEVTDGPTAPLLVAEDACAAAEAIATWTPDPNQTYEVEFSTNGADWTPPTTLGVGVATQVGLRPGPAFWRIRGGGGACVTDWREVGIEVYEAPAPNPIDATSLLTTPTSASPFSATLAWTPTTPRPSDGYTVEVFEDACGATLASGWPQVTSATSISTGAIATAGTYHWRVRANANGACPASAPSACATFTVEGTPPPPPNVLSTCLSPMPPAASVPCPVPVTLGTQYYVSPTGSNTNAGTSPGAPFATIGHALSVAASGSTIRVAAGTYAESPTITTTGLVVKGGYAASFDDATWNPDVDHTIVTGRLDLQAAETVFGGFRLIANPAPAISWPGQFHRVGAGTFVRNYVELYYDHPMPSLIYGIVASANAGQVVRIRCNDIWMRVTDTGTHGLKGLEFGNTAQHAGLATVDSNRVCTEGGTWVNNTISGYGSCSSSPGTLVAFNNVLENTSSRGKGLEFYGCSSGDLNLYLANNTVLSARDGLAGYAGSSMTWTVRWHLRNNVFFSPSSSGGAAVAVGQPGTLVDIVSSEGNLAFGFGANGFVPAPSSSMFDDTTGSYAPAQIFTSPTTGDFSPAVSGAAVGTGVNLYGDPTWGAITVDLLGRPRPTSGAWARGALEP